MIEELCLSGCIDATLSILLQLKKIRKSSSVKSCRILIKYFVTSQLRHAFHHLQVLQVCLMLQIDFFSIQWRWIPNSWKNVFEWHLVGQVSQLFPDFNGILPRLSLLKIPPGDDLLMPKRPLVDEFPSKKPLLGDFRKPWQNCDVAMMFSITRLHFPGRKKPSLRLSKNRVPQIWLSKIRKFLYPLVN